MSKRALRWTGSAELTICLSLLAIITGAGVGLALARQNPVDPRLVIAPGELSFGPVWEQPAFRHVIQVRNPSDRAVRVSEVRSGCGCTSIKPQTFVIPAGGQRELTATLNLAGYADKPFAVELIPQVAHQPPGQRTVWTLHGEVRPNPIQIEAATIHLGDQLVAGEPAKPYEIEVSLAEGAPFDSLRATGFEGFGQVELEPVAERRWRLRITPADDLEPGPFEHTIRLQTLPTDDAAPAYREITVKGTVRREIAAWPDALTFGVHEIGTAVEEYVVVASALGRAFEVTEIDAPPGVTVTTQPEQATEAGRVFLVRMKITASGAQSSTIQFHIRRHDPRPGESTETMVPLKVTYHRLETATRK